MLSCDAARAAHFACTSYNETRENGGRRSLVMEKRYTPLYMYVSVNLWMLSLSVNAFGRMHNCKNHFTLILYYRRYHRYQIIQLM